MATPRIVFRTDTSNQIGIEHFMRCLTLADVLKQSGVYIRFISRELPLHLCDILAEKGIEFESLGSNVNPSPIDDLAHAHWLGTSQVQDGQTTFISSTFWTERTGPTAALSTERGHVGPNVVNHPEWFHLGSLEKFKGLAHHRWTLDEPGYLVCVQSVFELFQTNDGIVRNGGLLKSVAADVEVA